MVLAGHMALSSSDDETLKDGGKYLAARFAGFQDRFHRLQERSRTIFLRRQRLNAERERREKQDALEKEEQEEQAVWNTSLHVYEYEKSTKGDLSRAAAVAVPESGGLGGGPGGSAAAVAVPELGGLGGGPGGSPGGSPLPSRLHRVPVHATMRILASPPPPLGPPMLLRNGLEAACLCFQEPLELLSREVCDFDRVEQRFVWDGATRTLRYARDTSQCVDYFTSLHDFGVWACFDAANDVFFYDAPTARYCLLLDHDKCVRTVTGEADEAVQLRVPGEAACLRLDEVQTPLSRHTCDDTRLTQRWRYEPALAAFRSVSAPEQCLDYSAEDQAFAVWPCEREEARETDRPSTSPNEHGFIYRQLQSRCCERQARALTCCLLSASRLHAQCMLVASGPPSSGTGWPLMTSLIH